MSEHIDSSQPPPRAAPSITEIVGQGIFSKPIKVFFILLRNCLTVASSIVLRSLRSAPAQNIPSVELLKIIQFAS